MPAALRSQAKTGSWSAKRHTSKGARAFSEYQRSGRIGALNSAVACFRDAVAATPSDHRDFGPRLSNLAISLEERFERTGNIADLDDAIEARKHAVDATPAGHQDLPRYLTLLGVALRDRFEQTGESGDLDEAIHTQRQAVAVAMPAHPDLPGCLGDLGASLRTRFERAGDVADLDAAIDTGKRAVAMGATGNSKGPAMLSCLGNSLLARFEQAGDAADLDAAIDAGRQAVAAAPPGHPVASHLLSLGVCLQVRFDRTGDTADLDAAIEVQRQAVAATPGGHQDLPMYRSNLAASLQKRFEWSGDVADLNAAINAGRQAVAGTTDRHPKLPMYLSNLAVSLAARSKRAGHSADLDAAIDAVRRALELAPPRHPSRRLYLSNLGVDLLSRYRRSGDSADLDAAIGAYREAITDTPRDNRDISRYKSNLGVCLQARFERTGDGGDLDEAIRAHQEAVASLPEPGDPRLPDRLLKLGTSLRTRFERDGDSADLDAAIDCWKRGAQVITAAPASRLVNYTAWGRAAAGAGRAHQAAEAYSAAVGLLPRLAWHGLNRETRQAHIAHWNDLTANAVACAIRAHRPEQAVELLEQGRSVLWAQALDLRTDLDELAERRPDLARRLDSIRKILDTPPPDAAQPGLPRPVAAWVTRRYQTAAELRRAKAREWDETLALIRRVEGFEHFLDITSYPDLVDASNGPAVMVNTGHYGSHALIVSAGDKRPQVVELTSLNRHSAIEQVSRMRRALGGLNDPVRSRKGRSEDLDAIFGVLEWLWDVVADPVLTAFGYADAPEPGSSWPRIWWCPTGPLALLPVHAAGHHPREGPTTSGDCVMDRVISSYTPTLTMLARARRPNVSATARQLSVGVAAAPGQLPLDAVPAEMKVLAHHFPPGHHHQQLTGPRATRAAVLAAAAASSWVHFACHAAQEATSPDRSGFALHDSVLTVSDLAAQPARHRELAFLSACQTATGSIRHPDEALHLAAAMLFLGYRHVIATMWSIGDSDAPEVADTVYTMLTREGKPDARRAAEAVHHAIRALRHSNPASPQTWAPYLHFGA